LITIETRLKQLAKRDLSNIEDVKAIQEHITQREMLIETLESEIARLNTFCWNQINLTGMRY